MPHSRNRRRGAIIRALVRSVGVMACLLWHAAAWAAPLTSLQYERHGPHERLVLNLKEESLYRIFTLENPNRLVVDIKEGRWSTDAVPPLPEDAMIAAVRHGRFKDDELRVVIDLRRNPASFEHFTEPATRKTPFQIVIDLHAEDAPPPRTSKPASKEEPKPKPPEKTFIPQPEEKPYPPRQRGQKRVIIIDPGHGGQDPGASGRTGEVEKEFTLRYAQSLRKALQETGHYEVHLTRNDDRYLRLRERIAIARAKKGELFLSLHADSHPNRLTRGLSVYTLSEDASDKEAEMLAQRENQADIISGMDLSGQAKDVTNILIELAQRETMNKSSRYAEMLVESLAEDIPMVRNTHRYAGFAVLKAPDIPSVLVELGFLTNPDDERQLRSKEYERKIVGGVLRSVDVYFEGGKE